MSVLKAILASADKSVPASAQWSSVLRSLKSSLPAVVEVKWGVVSEQVVCVTFAPKAVPPLAAIPQFLARVVIVIETIPS